MDLDLEESVNTEVKKPSDYKVVLLNDNYTPVEFVIHVLIHIFKKNYTEAQKLTEGIHNSGQGIAGVYSLEVARTKLMILEKVSRENNYPLVGKMEKLDD